MVSVRSVSSLFSVVIGFYTYLVSTTYIMLKLSETLVKTGDLVIHNAPEICGFVRVDIVRVFPVAYAVAGRGHLLLFAIFNDF